MHLQIIKNVFSNYFVNFLQMALGILIVPFLILKLGKEAFGLVILVESTIAIFEAMVLSVRIALSRHATFALAQDNLDEFIKYLSTGKFILFVIGLVVLVVGGLVSYFFAQIFSVPSSLVNQSSGLFLLVIFSFFITIPNIIYWSILYSKQRFDLINLASSFGLIFRAISIFILFSILPSKYISLVTYGLIFLLMKLVENSMIYLWHKNIMPGIKLTLKNFQYNKVKEILSFSGYTSLSTISTMLYENTANILINIFYGPAFNAIYGISLKIPIAMNNIFLRSTWSLAPTITDLVAKKDTDRLQKILFTYSKLLCIVTLPAILLIMVLSSAIIHLWVGNNFLQAAGLLSIHLVPLMLILPLSVVNLTVNAYAKVKVPSQVTFLIAVINVALGIFLAKICHLNLYGFAISAAICTIINSAIFLPFYSCKIAGLSVYEYVLNAFIKPLLLGCLIILPLYFILKFYNHHPNLKLILFQGAMISFVYYLFAYKLLINNYEKDIALNFFNKRSK